MHIKSLVRCCCQPAQEGTQRGRISDIGVKTGPWGHERGLLEVAGGRGQGMQQCMSCHANDSKGEPVKVVLCKQIGEIGLLPL